MSPITADATAQLASYPKLRYIIPQGNCSSLTDARRFCEKLAKSHYENFLVAGLFCPAELRQEFYNIYSYCRISDDLGDETGDIEGSLTLLNWWESELNQMYAGRPAHPVFIALRDTTENFGIPKQPFLDLLTAFRRDQAVTRHRDFDSVLEYCRYSANPVGRLVLYLCRCADEERFALSDKTCTALQLANFWQDVWRDFEKGRIYIPLEDMERFGYTEALLASRQFTPEFAELMRFQVDRTRTMFREGAALAGLVDRRLRLDIEMFTRGGLEVLRRIEIQGYDVLRRRPSVPKSRQLAILAGRVAASLVPARRSA